MCLKPGVVNVHMLWLKPKMPSNSVQCTFPRNTSITSSWLCIQYDVCQFKRKRNLQHSVFMPSSIAASVESCKDLFIDTICQSLQVLQPAPGVGTSGQIKKIRLENFMCHDNLLIEFTYV